MICYLIDLDDMIVLKSAEGDGCVKRLEYWAEILIPKKEFYICGNTRREMARWSLEEVTQLYENTEECEIKTKEYARSLELLSYCYRRVDIDDTDLMGLIRKLGRELGAPNLKPQKEKNPHKGESSTIVKRPKEGTMTERVWQVADWLYGEQDPKDFNCKDLRNKVIEACVNNEINASTATTQFAKWKRHLNQG